MLPLTRQEKTVLLTLIGVILAGSLGRCMMKLFPHQVRGLEFIENWDPCEKIDINQAGHAELIRLPHIGPARAEAILTYRRENGFFQYIGQLRQVPGIGEKSLQKIKPYIKIQKP